MARLKILPVLLCMFSNGVMAEAYTGKIVIDGVVMGEVGAGVATGDGQRSSQRREVPCFGEITVEAGVDLVVKRGSDCVVVIDADSNLIPLIATEVNGARLTVSTTRSIQSQGRIQVEATTPQLKRVDIQGASNVKLVSVQSPSLEIVLSGSGEVAGDGRVGQLDVVVDGSGDVNLGRLRSDNVKVRISGAADAEIYAEQSLKVDLEGAGDVRYFGNPAHVEKNISGAGAVVAAE